MKSFKAVFVTTSALMFLALPALAQENNTLTDTEKAAGWQLLFNGTNFDGWHNFRREGVAPGWQVKDGQLVCVNPQQAGDIISSHQFDWFELELDYNISDGGNSGVMFHVVETGPAMWFTGPECQLLDNVNGHDGPTKEGRQLAGWLYGLYKPPVDPATGKILDATKPAGEWNHLRLLMTPQKSEHDINGVKYFEYVLHSEDFNARVAKSKFGSMPAFCKADVGSIGLQGDHGSIAFRNIKIRVIKP